MAVELGNLRGGRNMNDVIGEVIDERKRQDEKWGADRELPPCEWLAIFGEEALEVYRGALAGEWDNYREELIQVAAVAIAAVESYDLQHGREAGQ